MATAKNISKLTTPIFRSSFLWGFKPQPPMEGSTGEPKYGVTMLFDAEARGTAQFKAMKDLASRAAKEKFGDKIVDDGAGWFKFKAGGRPLRNPFRDGSEKSELEGYEGMVFASATSKLQPGLVDAKLQRILSEDDFGSGDYARATVTAYGYDKAGNAGVAFGLNNLQKVRTGERFSGRTAAENDFEAVDDGAFSDEGGTNEDFLS